MSLTAHQLETARDAALGCARAAGRFLLDYCQPLDHGLLHDPLVLAEKALHDMGDLRSLVTAFTGAVTQPVLRFILAANSPGHQDAFFDGYHFPTFHEVACAAAEMTYVTLALLAEDLPQETRDPAALATLFRLELLDHQKQYGDFKSDRTVSSIEQEAAAAVRYLAALQMAGTPYVDGTGDYLSTFTLRAVPARDAIFEARDKMFYDEWVRGTRWRIIIDKQQGNFPPDYVIEGVAGVRRAARLYAVRHHLPIPESRPPGRPRL
jgi:hypothetical protein